MRLMKYDDKFKHDDEWFNILVDLYILQSLYSRGWFFKVDFYVMKVESKSTSRWWRH